MKVILYPLIGILHLSSATFSLFSFNPELGVVMAGLVASALISAVYVFPWFMLLGFLRKLKPSAKIVRVAGLIWAGSVLLIAFGEVAASSLLMMMSTGAFVLSTIASTTLALMRVVTKLRIR